METLPPAYWPHREKYHEVPQVFRYQGQWVLTFGSYIPGRCMRYVCSDDPLRWDRRDLGEVLLGGEDAVEYSAWVCDALPLPADGPLGAGPNVVHLVYEWRSQQQQKLETKGRCALPKMLMGELPGDLYLGIVPGFQPNTGDHQCMEDVRLSSSAGETTGACVEVSGAGPRCVSLTLSATDAVAGLRVDPYVGTHKGIQLTVDSGEAVIALQDDGARSPREWPAPDGPVRLSVTVAGKHVDAYVDGRFVGSACALQDGELNAYLVCTGPGQAKFTDICRRSLAICHMSSA